jgi:ribosomal protein S18 acetylase RimI-like enzyme
MFKVEVLEDKQTAERIGEFLTSQNAFEQTWAPNEKEMVMKAPLDSLNKENHRYWYIEKENQIIGAIGVRENKYGSGGYEMDSDYVAIHKDYRRHGLASKLLEAMENFVKERNGRYIHALTCDIESYKPALRFYEHNGYIKVAEIPDYYVESEGRIDYFKKI